MGIDLSTYRLRVGRFANVGCAKKSKIKSWHSQRPPTDCFNLTSVILSLVLICLLLISAGVESNPGPNFLYCKICEFKTKSVTSFVNHQYLHSQDRRFKFYCPLCPLSFKGLNSFKTHLSRNHPQSRKRNRKVPAPSGTIPGFKCSICSQTSSTQSDLRIHLCSHVSNGEQVYCPFPSCRRHRINPFTRAATFRTHWSEYHKFQKPPIVSITEKAAEQECGASFDPSDFESSDEENGNDVGEQQSAALYASNFQDFLAKFYLKLETVYHVASSTVQQISEDLTKISEMTQQSIAHKLRSCLKNENLDEDSIKNICLSSLDADRFYKVHHKGLSDDPLVSKHLREKYFKKNFKHVPPKKPIFWGRNKFGKKRYVHYVPIKETLNVFLADESVKQQVRASFQRTSRPGVYADYCDGEAFKTRFVGRLKKSIHLILFQDGLELVNPLGAARVKHKAIGMYFTLGNLSAKSRSKVHTLLLAQMFFEKDLKNFKGAIFKDLLADLKELEQEGIMFDGEKIPVILTFIVGDNLGSHMIGGFQESFSVEYFCRYCEISRDTFKKNSHSLLAPLRTVESYERCIEDLKSNPDPAVDSVKGIKFPSVFNELRHFHVCAPALPPCVAHDFLLGVLPHDMRIFIQYFVSKKWFSYDVLNRRIASFKLKYNDARNRPPTLTETEHKIVGSAVQNWNFLRFFGLMVGDLVQDTQNPVWQLYLALKKIGSYVCAPELHESQITYLDTIIEEYLYDLARCEPDKLKVSFICKHHYMRHYALLIILFGPLPRLWTLNFEAKHSWMRQVALSSKNFIHVTKTITDKHQLFFAYLCSGQLFSEEVECSSPYPLDATQFSVPQCLAMEEHNINVSQSFQVKVVGTPPVQYHSGQWIILKHNDEGLHVGCIVANIQDQSGRLHLLLNQYLTDYDCDFGHYVIRGRYVTQPRPKVVEINKLEHFYPLNQYVFKGQLCLSLKYVVVMD